MAAEAELVALAPDAAEPACVVRSEARGVGGRAWAGVARAGGAEQKKLTLTSALPPHHLPSFSPHPPSLDAAAAPAASLDAEATAAPDGAPLGEDDVDPIDKLQEMGVNAGER